MKIIDIKGMFQADPYVIKFRDKFYMYCTGKEGVPFYVSDRIDGGWRFGGTALTIEGMKEYWAPAVLEKNGKFYMYVSAMPLNSFDVHEQALKVAVADSPEGPFAYACDLLPPFSIDAHVVENSEGMFLFYSANSFEGDKIGTYILVDRMKDPFTAEGRPKAVALPTLQQEMFQKNRFKEGQDWYTLEGAFYFKKDGVHYCMYSGNCYMKESYFIGYCFSRDASDKLNEIDFIKYPADGTFCPLIASDENEQSTGHNSVIEVDGCLYAVYHGRDADSDLATDDRTARICRLKACDGVLKAEKM